MMKSMLLYRITAESAKVLNNHAALTLALEKRQERLPEGSQWRTLGFAPPAPSINDNLVWNGQGNVNLFCLKIHKRDLSSATVKEYVAKKVRKVEERESRKIYRKEYAQFKEEVEAELLPKAFIKHSAILMMVVGDLLVVGASTFKNAEDALSTLRDAMGSLGVRPFTTKVTPEEWLTKRLMQHGKLGSLVRGDSVKMANEAKDVVTFKGVDLSDDEPQNYTYQGFRVKEITLDMDGEVFFKLTDGLIFKGMKFSEVKLHSARRDTDGDLAATVDADIILFTDTITRIVDSLVVNVGELRGTEKELAVMDEDTVEKLQALVAQFRKDNPNLYLAGGGPSLSDVEEALGDAEWSGHLEDLFDPEERERLLREQFQVFEEDGAPAIDPLDPDEDF